ncbi:n-acetylglutamate synthase [Roseivirga sp.]|uniref:n-acetylglutamate synthase n=1 Tax=Roseivirga sp. TaxID=1964215 RepID=UPI003B8BF18F
MTINYNNRVFRPVNNTENSETSSETTFYYKQEGNILSAEYKGGQIIKGHLIGLVDDKGNIDMRYHQVNKAGELMTGTCKSTPETMENGGIRLLETWQWTSGDHSKGESIIEEVIA